MACEAVRPSIDGETRRLLLGRNDMGLRADRAIFPARRCKSWRRLAKAVFALSLLFAGPAPAQKPDAIDGTADIAVGARRIANFHRTGSEQRFGRLEFRGGLVLTTPSKDFGGWSGLAMDPDGRRMLAVSDAGAWLVADVLYDGNRLAGLAKARIGPLRSATGQTLARGRDRDAEDVVLLDGTIARGSVLIAFEQNHRIGRFATGDSGLTAPQTYMKRAPEFQRMRPNQGIEAVTVLRGGPLRGAIVAFAEFMTDGQRNHTGWIWAKGPQGDPQRLFLPVVADFAITGAASLPDGSLIVLERYFRWTEGVKMRLRLVPAAELKPGAVLRGETLIEADMSYEIDNMEGVAVHRGAGGEAVITMISDNNFNGFLQRTLMLQFALAPTRTTAAPK